MEIKGARTWGLAPCDSQLGAKLAVSGLRCAEEGVDEHILGGQTLLKHLSGRHAGLQSEHSLWLPPCDQGEKRFASPDLPQS